MLSLFSNTQLMALLTGLGTSAGLIVAIGAQNAFVLSQGLRRQHHWPIAGLCSFFDALLITVGVAGMGVLIAESPVWMEVARWGGALFLIIYGARSLYSAFTPSALSTTKSSTGSLRKALLMTLAVTLLNPHAYLDTVVLLGSIGGQYPLGERFWFAGGAISFSFLWFFGLAVAAKFLQPVFQKPKAWQVLDTFVCITMWAIALKLLWPVLFV